MSTVEKFEKAVFLITKGNAKNPPSAFEKLNFYGLFKQATSGDVQGKAPSKLNMVARGKYDAHAKRKGMSKEEAMKEYVKLLESRNKNWEKEADELKAKL